MGVMTTMELKNNIIWDYTCKICKVIRTALSVAFVGMIAVGESAGRARAAAELTRMGYHAEAKNIMLGKDPR